MAEILKERINRKWITSLAQQLAEAEPSFNKSRFLSSIINKEWEGLELKARMRRVSTVLGETLPGPYPQQIETLKQVVAEFRGLAGLIFPDFVEVYGAEHFKVSIDALKTFTPYSSSEFAIRSFIKSQPEKMMGILQKWTKDKNDHVRRLASEGCRPRLPWSFKLDVFIKDPAPVLALLENLKADESLYVRKSVANNLNDISKDHPELVLERAKSWLGQSELTDWIVRHALRTLLKRGDKRALALFGHDKANGIKVTGLKVEKKKNKIGTEFKFSFKLVNTGKKNRNLRVEYGVHYVKKGGQTSRKVFRLAEKLVPSGELAISKKHSLRQMTTRIHYPGKHRLEIIVNGEALAETEFLLL